MREGGREGGESNHGRLRRPVAHRCPQEMAWGGGGEMTAPRREMPKRKRSLAPSTEATALVPNLSLHQLCQRPEIHQSVPSQYIGWNCRLMC